MHTQLNFSRNSKAFDAAALQVGEYEDVKGVWEYCDSAEDVEKADRAFRTFCTRYNKRYNIPSHHSSGLFTHITTKETFTVLINCNGIIAIYKHLNDGAITLMKKPDPTLVYEVNAWFA